MVKAHLVPDQKINLLANTVHEIRTPVQTIISTLEFLSDTPLNDEQTEYVRQIQFSADVLLSLINNILDYAKIRSREFKLEHIPFDIIRLTEQVADFVSIEAGGKQLELVTDVDYRVPPSVLGDPTRVQVVLINLIKNAVKFTASGYVHIELYRKDTDTLLFTVTDSGIGIPTEKQKNLFSDYYQVDSSTTRTYGGTGLGLAICRSLIIAMHGEIGMKPNPYGGSIFWFTIPLTPAPAPSPLPPEEFFVPRDTRIMIVDDNALALKSMARKLASLNLTAVECVQTAQEAVLALEYAAQIGQPFKIVFIDMVMPRIDGWHLAADINAHPALHGVKCYLMIPEGQLGSEAKMKLLHWFAGYLYKPVKQEKLRAVLNATYDPPIDVEPFETSQAPVAADTDSTVARGITILVAEDHPVNRQLLSTILKKYGARVYEAENGAAAVKAVQAHPEIVMVFMDIQMPVLNGIAASKHLLAHKYAGTIVACTANNDENDFSLYRNIGMHDILVKPFKRAAVKALIEKWKTTHPNAVSAQHKTPDQAQPVKRTVPVTAFPLWDWTDFEDTIAGNNELGCKLLEEYCAQTERLLQQAAAAQTRSDFGELERIGHTLKGSSGTISATRLQEIGRAMERQAHTAHAENSKKARTLFLREFARFKQLAEGWRNAHEDKLPHAH
ncbi:MAG: response regulator [Treponema sp.]|nr:response regulator [Treponema sp.]